MKRSRRLRPAKRAVMTEPEYRELIQAFVDRARSDQQVAELLAAEARLRFGAGSNVPEETE